MLAYIYMKGVVNKLVLRGLQCRLIRDELGGQVRNFRQVDRIFGTCKIGIVAIRHRERVSDYPARHCEYVMRAQYVRTNFFSYEL